MTDSSVTALLALTHQDILNMDLAELKQAHAVLDKTCDKMQRPGSRQLLVNPQGSDADLKAIKNKKVEMKTRIAHLEAQERPATFDPLPSEEAMLAALAPGHKPHPVETVISMVSYAASHAEKHGYQPILSGDTGYAQTA